MIDYGVLDSIPKAFGIALPDGSGQAELTILNLFISNAH